MYNLRVLKCKALHAIDATRFHQRRRWVFFFWTFEAIRTASRRDGPDAVRDGSKSTKRPPTACSPQTPSTRRKRRSTDAVSDGNAPRRPSRSGRSTTRSSTSGTSWERS